uniref:Uncharacterized protein n=1 Tax=Mustela putorius furo TaxID=9669 RepID=M3Z401_MUSPF
MVRAGEGLPAGTRAQGDCGMQGPEGMGDSGGQDSGQSQKDALCGGRCRDPPFPGTGLGRAALAEAGGGLRALTAGPAGGADRTQGPRPGPSQGAAPGLTKGKLEGQAARECPPTVTDGPKRGQSNQRKQILLETARPQGATEDLKGPLRAVAGSPPAEGQSSKPWRGRAGGLRLRGLGWPCGGWAGRGGQPGGSYGISSLLAGKEPGEAKTPSWREGAQAGGGYRLTGTQTLVPDATHSPLRRRDRMRNPGRPLPVTPHPHPNPRGGSRPLSSPHPSATLYPLPRPREQVRGQGVPTLPCGAIASPPTPWLTGGRNKREQLGQDTCPYPVSLGPTGLPWGVHRGVTKEASSCGGWRKGAQRSSPPFRLGPSSRATPSHCPSQDTEHTHTLRRDPQNLRSAAPSPCLHAA